jgi:peptide deformylase
MPLGNPVGNKYRMELTRRTLKLKLKPADLHNQWANEDLVIRMLQVMHEHHGIGLAANQVGERIRMFVMYIDGHSWGCFNPEIVQTYNDLTNFDEGCLSFPGETCIIKRPDTIDVRYYDVAGIEVIEKLTGLASRCFQHELDHLNGITMHDRYKEQNAEQSGN